MKKVIFISLAISVITGNFLLAQSGFLNKVTRTVSNYVLGKPETANNEKKHITHCDVTRQYFYHSNTIMVLKHVKAESAPELLVC
jgi:hypothetical protein